MSKEKTDESAEETTTGGGPRGLMVAGPASSCAIRGPTTPRGKPGRRVTRGRERPGAPMQEALSEYEEYARALR